MYNCRLSLSSLILLLLTLVGAPVQAASTIESAGDAIQIALPMAAAGLTLYRWDTTGGVQLVESAVLSTGATYALKYTVNATRPNGGSHSFPSGHASISFMSAEYLRNRYGWEYGVPAYALASFVAYSRVYADQHYARDVVAGAAIGIASSYIFTSPIKGMTVQPTVDAGYYGLKLSRLW